MGINIVSRLCYEDRMGMISKAMRLVGTNIGTNMHTTSNSKIILITNFQSDVQWKNTPQDQGHVRK